MKLKGGLILALAWLIFLGGDGSPPLVRLAFLGDIMLGRGVAKAHSDGSWRDVFSPLTQELQQVDFSLANLESPICEDDSRNIPEMNSGAYILNAPKEGLEALYPLGLRIVSLANNHSLDCGLNGLMVTKAALEEMSVDVLINAGEPIFLDTRQGRFAFLGFNDIGTKLDIRSAAQSVRLAKQSAAFVVVSMHWGLEYQPGANERQRELAQALADAGAALIWGHHPHVLQPPAWVQGREQPQPTLVLYSLGNALFDQHAPPDAKRSTMVIVTFDSDGVVSMEIFPFVIGSRGGRIITASSEEIDMIYRRMKIDKPQTSKEEISWAKLPTAVK